MSHQTKREPKRKRGGQKGNQNARKHGFYAANLSVSEICRFWNIINRGGIEPEIVALRIKLESALHSRAANHRVLREASRLLSKWYRSKYRFDGADNTEFKKAVLSILERIKCGSWNFAGTNRA